LMRFTVSAFIGVGVGVLAMICFLTVEGRYPRKDNGHKPPLPVKRFN